VAEANLLPPFQLERYYNKCEKYVLEKIRIWEASKDQKFRDAILLWKEDYERDIAFYQKLETEDPARACSLRQSAKTVSKLITIEKIDFFSKALKQKGLTLKDYLTHAQMRALAVAKRRASQTTTTTPAIPSQTSSQQRGTGKKTKRNSLEVGGTGSQQKKQKVTTTPSGKTWKGAMEGWWRDERTEKQGTATEGWRDRGTKEQRDRGIGDRGTGRHRQKDSGTERCKNKGTGGQEDRRAGNAEQRDRDKGMEGWMNKGTER